MMILCDIGGTHARFAQLDGKKVIHVEKYKASDFECFEDAIQNYCKQKDIHQKTSLHIATAAYPNENGKWVFVNKNEWEIDPESLAVKGWHIQNILNDFEAAAWALADLGDDARVLIKPGTKDNTCPVCLIGPGTGLGLAYYRSNHVQKTHGGHMIATVINDEQQSVVNYVKKVIGSRSPVVFENLVSGPGLVHLHNAVSGEKKISNAEEFLNTLESESGKTALRLFHEFLGLFAHTALVTGHAYGGLYLMGGIIERLCEQGLFDTDKFIKSMKQRGVSSVENAINGTPVYIVTDANPAFLGLKHISEKNS